MEPHEFYYAAVLARDPRFDGKFFTAVKTTGIYCRPVCPARPKRENVEFFATKEEAERHGYRPCRRCRPEAAPRSPAWQGTAAVVSRALRELTEETAARFDEEQFAARFGLSARHVRRLFVSSLGKSPKQLLLDIRLGFARSLVAETNLPLGEVAHAAGFGSLRRFNDAFLRRYGAAPGASRKRPGRKTAPLELTLPYRPPLNFEALLEFYRWHQVADLEEFTEHTMHRIVELGGVVGRISIRQDAEAHALKVAVDFPDLSYLPAILGRVRNLFDLDADPLQIGKAFSRDREIFKLWRKHPGMRLASGWDPFEIGVGTILGQFVSLACARSLVRALVENVGEERATPAGPRRLFPAPRAVAESDLAFLRTTGVRRETLRGFARSVADGSLSLAPTQDPAQFYQKLLALKGIGPWTASYMTLKILRHTDAFPATDLILARALEIHAAERVEKLKPWRGYAAVLFWREYAASLSKAPKKKSAAEVSPRKEKKEWNSP